MEKSSPVLQFVLKHITLIIFFLLLVVSAMTSSVFLSERNIMNLLRQVTPNGLASLGMLFIILTGGIDLSVGSILALASVVCALAAPQYSAAMCIAFSILVGAAMGAFHGLLVAGRNIAPFVATLCGMTIARGLAFIYSNAAPIRLPKNAVFLQDFSVNSYLGLPGPVLVLVVVFLLCWFTLKMTSFGRLVVAIGSNETAVRLAGIRTGWYKFWVYVICGASCGMAGVISVTRTNIGSANAGLGLELDAIAAAVIGGASLAGGYGSAVHTLLGVLILGMIGNIMNLTGIPSYQQQVTKGLIIAAAVLLQSIKKRD